VDPAGVDALRDAIRHMHGCESTWIESVPVTETFKGATVWDGEVHVFDLVGHKTAARLCVEPRDRWREAPLLRRAARRARDERAHGSTCVHRGRVIDFRAESEGVEPHR
jgi:hypothetical protein